MDRLGFVITARMSSLRLPGKVLKKICGRTCLEHLVGRLARSKHTNRIVIATSTEPEDIQIAEEAERLKVNCYRGRLNDVLGRLAETIINFDIDPLVLVGGDRAMQDIEIVDYIIDRYSESYPKYDCIVNINKHKAYSFPQGQIVYVIKAEAILRADEIVKGENEREHIHSTFFINNDIFQIKTIKGSKYWNRPDIRTAIDTPEDFEFNCRIFKELETQNPYFGIKEVIELLDKKPELKRINT